MGALMGQLQFLQGLCIDINSNANHVEACCWITIAIIIHNMVIDIEGTNAGESFGNLHNGAEELEDCGIPLPYEDDDDEMEQAGEIKHHRLVVEIVTYKSMCKHRTVLTFPTPFRPSLDHHSLSPLSLHNE